MEAGVGLVVDYRESLVKGRESHAVEIDPKRKHRGREMNQGQSGTRVRVATVQGGRNDGRWAGSDALVRDSCSCPDLDSTLDLCACPCHGVRDLGWRSTGLSTQDSYGTQP